jgi:hypothetical protein
MLSAAGPDWARGVEAPCVSAVRMKHKIPPLRTPCGRAAVGMTLREPRNCSDRMPTICSTRVRRQIPEIGKVSGSRS